MLLLQVAAAEHALIGCFTAGEYRWVLSVVQDMRNTDSDGYRVRQAWQETASSGGKKPLNLLMSKDMEGNITETALCFVLVINPPCCQQGKL